jgi:hypothetical protein
LRRFSSSADRVGEAVLLDTTGEATGLGVTSAGVVFDPVSA